MSAFNVSFPLQVRESDGQYRDATQEEVIAVARRVLGYRVRRGAALDSPKVVRDFLCLQLGDREHEVFAALFVNAQNRLIAYKELFRGTLTQASVYPREMVKEALAANASAVVFVHNHPSGLPEPSGADQVLTLRLKEALETVDVRVLDHFIVAGDATMSFAERGLL
jgi:DNA repair protein RadC